MKNVFLSIIAFLILASCSTMISSRKGSQPSIVNTKWVLSENVKGKTPTLNIENGRVSGNAGCNNYFGELLMDSTAGNFSATKVGSTRMMCENMSVEDNFMKMLSEVNKYTVNGNVLELYKDDLLLMKFTKN